MYSPFPGGRWAKSSTPSMVRVPACRCSPGSSLRSWSGPRPCCPGWGCPRPRWPPRRWPPAPRWPRSRRCAGPPPRSGPAGRGRAPPPSAPSSRRGWSSPGVHHQVRDDPHGGVGAIPEVASEPPHSVPTIRAETGSAPAAARPGAPPAAAPAPPRGRWPARSPPPRPERSPLPACRGPGPGARSTRSASPPSSVTPITIAAPRWGCWRRRPGCALSGPATPAPPSRRPAGAAPPRPG